MTGYASLVKRNCKLFFRDKGLFFTSLITPLILLVLYVTFLANVFKDSFLSAMPSGFTVSDALVNGTVACQLLSSLLAVCPVTITFCANLLMVQDKISGARKDLTITPVKKSTLALSYFSATAISTLIISLVATGISFIYVAKSGWYFSVKDVFCIILDVVMLVLFGTAISSIVSYPLKTSGQASAVGTIVSAGYGFICGAYMPISSFSEGLQKALLFLPGTYGTSLLRNHALRGVYEEMANQHIPSEAIQGIKDSLDCNLYLFDNKIEIGTMYLIFGGAVILLIAIYILINVFDKSKNASK